MEYTYEEDDRRSFSFDDFDGALDEFDDDDEDYDIDLDAVPGDGGVSDGGNGKDPMLPNDGIVDMAEEEEDVGNVRDMGLSNSAAQSWLIRIPVDLAERLEKVERRGDNVGTISITYKARRTMDIDKISIQLDSKNPHFEDIPQTYDVDLLDSRVANTFVFEEPRVMPPIEDEANAAATAAAATAAVPLQPPASASASASAASKKGKAPAVAPAPAQEPRIIDGTHAVDLATGIGRARSVVSRVMHRCNARPSSASSLHALPHMRMHTARRKQSGPRVLGISKVGVETYLNPLDYKDPRAAQTQARKQDIFADMVKRPVRKAEEKMHRMEEARLVDILFTCFTRYQYWTLGALVLHTQQPRVWLRDVLGTIAESVRSGQYHGTYRLREEYRGKGIEDGSRAGEPEAESVDAGNIVEDDTMMDEDMDEDEEELAHLGVVDM